MICQAFDLIQLGKRCLRPFPCEEEATLINYEESIYFCDKHYKIELEHQPEVMERIGKFYPIKREEPELKLLKFD